MGFSLLRPYRCYSHCVNLLFGFVEVLEGRTFTFKTCQAAASSSQRLVICPTRPGSLPWAAGYAEVDTPKTSNVYTPSAAAETCYNTAWLCWFIREAFPKNNARIANTVQPKLPPALLTIWATFVTFKKVSKSIWVGHPPFPHNNLGNFFTFENVTKSIWRRTKRKSVFFREGYPYFVSSILEVMVYK